MTTRTRPIPPNRKDSTGESSSSNSDPRLKDIKEVAKKAVKEHEELKRKYSKKEFQTLQLVEELEQTKEILNRLENASGMVIEEYQDVQCKLDIEMQCRVEAEKYATKTVREIKDLKRKSQMIFAQNGIDFSTIVDISIDENDQAAFSMDGDDQVSPQTEELNAQIEMLKEQLLKANKDLVFKEEELDNAREDMNGAYFQVTSLREELKRETVAHEMTKKALQERDNVINQLKRVSSLVYDEFNQVQLLYHKESCMREQAEQLASEYYAKNRENDAFRRQSAMLLNDAIGGDMKLIESMSEVERITKELEEEREKHKMELKQVQEDLEASQDRERMEQMENKLSIAKEENESLETTVKELEQRTKELEYELKEAANKPSLPNIPPPPPPPPMPQLPKNPLEMLQKMIGKKKPKASSNPDERNLDGYQKQFEVAMADMIHRIKKGQVKLKPTQVDGPADHKKGPEIKQKPGTAKAVKELDDILHNLKNRRANRPLVLHKGTQQTAQDADFQKIMQRRLQKSHDGDQPSTSKKSSRPVAQPRVSPSKLNKSTSLDSANLPNRTTATSKVPPPSPTKAAKRAPLAATASEPPPVPEPVYSTVAGDNNPPRALSTASSSTSSSTLSSYPSLGSSQEMEIQNNPAFRESGDDDETYSTADFPSPPGGADVSGSSGGGGCIPVVLPGMPYATMTSSPQHQQQQQQQQQELRQSAKFMISSDFGESGDYSLVEEREKPVPSPRQSMPSTPKREPRSKPSTPKREARPVPQEEPEPYYSEVNL